MALAEQMVGLHSTDPATVILAAAARLKRPNVERIEQALYDDRTLVRTLCMRRTLFVVPVDLVPIVHAAVTEALIPPERKRTVRMIEEAGIARDGARWLRRAEAETMAAIEEGGEVTGADLSKLVPRLREQIPYGEGKTWAGKIGMTTRVLFLLACEQRVVRGRPAGLVDEHAVPVGADDVVAPGRVPGLEGGRGARRAGAALAGRVRTGDRCGPQVVDGLDARPDPQAGRRAGHGGGRARPRRHRHRARRRRRRRCGHRSRGPPCCRASTRPRWAGPSGSGTSARTSRRCSIAPATPGPQCGGTVASSGGWTQRADGEIVWRPLEDVGADGRRAIEREIERLQTWLAGAVVVPRFPTPLAQELRADSCMP